MIVNGEMTASTDRQPSRQWGRGVFGEIALLDDGPCSATLVADTDVQPLMGCISKFRPTRVVCAVLGSGMLTS